MLNIYFGDMPEAIYDTSTYFNNAYLDSWIEEPFSREILKNIDKAEVLGPQAVKSKALGVIPVMSISGGAKTLLLIDHLPTKVFNASTCGDNCAKWILKIAQRHKEDITINLYHIMDFDAGRSTTRPFQIRILNTGKIVHTMAELAMDAGLILQEGEAL